MEAKKTAMVFPGTVLCTEEEFGQGLNTLVDLQGNVVSLAIGTPVFDSAGRMVRIEKKTRQIQPLSVRALAIGRVVLVKDAAAVIEILSAEKNGFPQAIPNSSSAIPVSRMDQGFVRSARDKFRVGDLVYAIVEKVEKWGIDLNTQSYEFGVIRAFCSRCRNPMKLDGRELKCTVCGSREYRKVSSRYGMH